MAEPTTTTESAFPDDIDPVFFAFEADPVDERTHVEAQKHNFQEQKIKRLQEYIGLHLGGGDGGGSGPTGWDPSNPTAPPTGRETINERITKVGGTGGCIEQGVICNYSGDGGIDPGGLVQAMTGEVPYFVVPPTGWIPLEPPNPNPSCPPFPDQPPYPTPTPTGYPTPIPDGSPTIPPGDYNPDTYPWPAPGFDPETDDAFPMGPWMQFMTWGLGTFFAHVQAQNAGNINFGPFGLPFANLPGAWQNVINLVRVFANTTADMPAGAGVPLLDDPNTLGRTSFLNVLDSLLSVASQVIGAMGIEVIKLVGDGDTVITHSFANGINGGEPGRDHGAHFIAISPDAEYTVDQVEQAAAKIEGWSGPGIFDVRFDQTVTAGHIVYLVCMNARPPMLSQGSSFTKRQLAIGGGPNFVLPTVAYDVNTDGVADLLVWASVAPGGPYVFLCNNGTAAATGANDYGTTLVGSTFTVLTFGASGYTEIYVQYQEDPNFK